MQRLAGIAVIALTLPVLAGAQRPTPVVSELRSTDMMRRMNAFLSLGDTGWTRPEMRVALRDLLIRENGVMDSVNALGKGTSELFGEGWGEYLSQIVGACRRHCDRRDTVVIRALATTAYNEDSAYARELARMHGREILPIMLERTRASASITRTTAFRMLGTIGRHGTGLRAGELSAIRAAVRAGARADHVGVRIAAVIALGDVGTTEDLAFLRQVSATDTVRIPRSGDYPVREFAAMAIRAIMSRP